MLTLFHDFTSPASAVAVLRMARLAEEGLPISFEGFEAVGVDMAMPVDLDTLAAIPTLRPAAAELGLQLRRPRLLVPTGLAHVLDDHAERSGCGPAVREGLYRAVWEDDADISDPDVLLDVAAAEGLADADEVLADRLALAARRRRMTTHRRAGVGGVPLLLASRTLVPGLLDEAQIRALAASV